MVAPSPYKSEILHQAIEMYLKNVHEKTYNRRKAKGCFDFSMIVGILCQAVEMQASVNKKQMAAANHNPGKIKELQRLQSLIKKNKDSIEKDPSMFGFQTPQQNKNGLVSQFTVGDMKHPNNASPQVSAAKTTPAASVSID